MTSKISSKLAPEEFSKISSKLAPEEFSKIIPKTPVLETRDVNVKFDQHFTMARTCLVKSWKIKTENIKVKLHVNNIEVDLDCIDGVNFDFPTIRQALRDVLPMSEKENELCVLEATLFAAQFTAVQYYSYFPAKLMNDFYFTGTLSTTFLPYDLEGKPIKLDVVDIEEVYIKPSNLLE